MQNSTLAPVSDSADKLSAADRQARIKAGLPPLTDQELAHMKNLGYLVIDAVTSQEEVAEIRKVLEALFDSKAGYKEGALFNFAGAEDDPNAPNIPQIVGVHNYAGNLRKTEFYKMASEMARQILGPEARFHIDHTLCKPPVDGAATPWHQDEAFKDPKFDYSEISFWMPLQPVDEINGCMQFVPGSHQKGILKHRTPNDDPRIHAFECAEFNVADAVACPLPAGGCTLHYERTIHGAGPNRSQAPRYAYVLIFQIPPESAKEQKVFPWQQGKHTARMDRANQWKESGGKYVKFWREFKSKEFRDYKQTFGKIKKKLLARFGR